MGKSSTSLRARGRSPYLLWSIWVVWLPFTLPALSEFLLSRPEWPLLVVNLTGLTLFVSIYLWATLSNARRLVAATVPAQPGTALVWLPIVLLTLLSFFMVVSNGIAWGPLFIFTAAYASGRLPTMQAVLMLLALIVIIALGSWYSHVNWPDALQGMGLAAIVGIVVIGLVRSVATDRELHEAREEIARLAVMTERLRIARDLHDLLGHNLSLIALKSELAGRLLKVAPERAAIEISDVEHTARTTLEEVREAVTNYRQPTLANELHAASEILAAAGIDYRYQGDESSSEILPTPLDALFSWAVREGVTNVIRHSHAHQCIIHVTRDKQQASVEVIDDGQGSLIETASIHQTGSSGNGLRGLKERVIALGGKCETGSCTTGGFRLAVSVPLIQRNHRRDASRAVL